MTNSQSSLPTLTVSRDFITEFVNSAPPCFALGLVEVGGQQTGILAMRPDCTIPAEAMAGGFNFGHGLIGTSDYVMSQFVFQFYDFAVYQALINPAKPMVQSIMGTMVEQGDYFFFAINSDNSTTVFRSKLGQENIAGIRTNMPMIKAATTTDEQYEQGLQAFALHPQPEGILLDWVCQDNLDYLALTKNPMEMCPVA